jgi:ribosomal protein L7/L12
MPDDKIEVTVENRAVFLDEKEAERIMWDLQNKLHSRKMTRLIDKIDADNSSEQSKRQKECLETVAGLLRDGKKIHAVKHFRDEMGCGLREAKDYVEGMEAKANAAAAASVSPTVAF